jgi:hypothetical protein
MRLFLLLAALCGGVSSHTAIIYAHFSDDLGDTNLNFFLKHGGIVAKPQYHYIFVVSGPPSPETSEALDAAQQEHPLTVEWYVRENSGYDFCAWNEVLYDMLPVRANLSAMDHFILINKSVRGPFVPPYLKQVDWPDLFTARLAEEGVGLSGTTVNCDKWETELHLQSMVLAFNATIKDTIARQHVQCWHDKDVVVREGEIGFSAAIIRAGMRLASTMAAFGGRPLPNEETATVCSALHSQNPGAVHTTDPYYPNNAGGISIHPLEVIFFKSNRKVQPEVLDAYTAFYANDIEAWGKNNDWGHWAKTWWRWLWGQ